jgi:hypothetical protein
MSNEGNQVADYVAHGFHKLDDRVMDTHPPKIVWGASWKKRSIESKLQWLEKFAHTMNHAAKLLTVERDKLGKMCEVKEAQLIKMGKQVAANNQMLQSEVTKMNEWKQQYLANVKRLNAEIKGLKNGNHD